MSADVRREEVKNRVREAADIVEVIGECVELTRRGRNYTGRCPFHAEKTPSFSVNSQGQFFHCFGCGESGDVFSFVMKYQRVSFPEALKHLAERYRIELPEQKMSTEDRQRMRRREQLYQVNEAAAQVFSEYLENDENATPAREYLVQRGVPVEMRRSYRLGYAPCPEKGGWSFLLDRLESQGLSAAMLEAAGLAVRREHKSGHYDRFRDRVLFPILDMTGRVVAFGGRILGEGTPKYMNSPESLVFDKSRLLFGLFQHRQAIRNQRRALVVEGNFDLLLLAVHGIDNVVAPLGTSLTRQHVKSLRGYADEVVLLFDGDAAGLKAAMRSIPFFLAEQVEARVALLPTGHDPDSLVREEGTSAVAGLVDKARPLPEFVFDTLSREHGLTLAGKNRIIRELQPILKAATGQNERALMLAHFGDKLGLSPAQLMTRPVGSVRSLQSEAPKETCTSMEQLPRQERQLCDFLIQYPEFLGELLDAGLEKEVDEPPVRRLVSLLKEMAAEEASTPEELFARLEVAGDRNYVAALLCTGGGSYTESSAEERQMCDELLHWLRRKRRRRTGAELQMRISEAQQQGDQQLLMKLLQQKMKMCEENRNS